MICPSCGLDSPAETCLGCGRRLSVLSSGTLLADRYEVSAPTMSRMVSGLVDRGFVSRVEDPDDRRLHAEAIACPACGPKLALVSASGTRLDGNPIISAARLLRSGAIVAVKGIGGFQLMVHAGKAEAVRRLRARKGRDVKPFAVMFPDIASARTCCRIDAAEEALLQSRAAPILLLRPARGSSLVPGVCSLSPWIGALLPYVLLVLILVSKPRGLMGTRDT